MTNKPFDKTLLRERFDKLYRQVSGFVMSGEVLVVSGFADYLLTHLPLTHHHSPLTNNTVARQPMSLTWFPFNAGNAPGNRYSNSKNLINQI